MVRPVRISIIQFGVDARDPAANLAAMEKAVRAHRSSDLVVFPELALHGHGLAHGLRKDATHKLRAELDAVHPDQVATFERTIAESETIVAYGSLAASNGHLENLAILTDGKELRTEYAKTHVHWTEPYRRGHTFPVARSRIGDIGMLICFDAAFPEVPRALALNGAEMILNLSAIPASFPIKYVHRRLVACSLENQVFTVFANRSGEGYRGGSAVVDPRGETVAVADEKQEALVVTVDMDEVAAWRSEERLFEHRRPELYDALVEDRMRKT